MTKLSTVVVCNFSNIVTTVLRIVKLESLVADLRAACPPIARLRSRHARRRRQDSAIHIRDNGKTMTYLYPFRTRHS